MPFITKHAKEKHRQVCPYKFDSVLHIFKIRVFKNPLPHALSLSLSLAKHTSASTPMHMTFIQEVNKQIRVETNLNKSLLTVYSCRARRASKDVLLSILIPPM